VGGRSVFAARDIRVSKVVHREDGALGGAPLIHHIGQRLAHGSAISSSKPPRRRPVGPRLGNQTAWEVPVGAAGPFVRGAPSRVVLAWQLNAKFRIRFPSLRDRGRRITFVLPRATRKTRVTLEHKAPRCASARWRGACREGLRVRRTVGRSACFVFGNAVAS